MIFEKSYQRLTCSNTRSVNGVDETTVDIDVRSVPSAKVGANVYGSWVELNDHYGKKIAHMLREWDPRLGTCEPNFLQIMKRHHDLYVMGAFVPAGEDHIEHPGIRTLSHAIGELEDGVYRTHDRTWHQIPIQGDHGDFIWEYGMSGIRVTARRKNNGSVFITEIKFSKEDYKYPHPRNEAFDPEAFMSVTEKVRYASLNALPITTTDIGRISRKLHP